MMRMLALVLLVLLLLHHLHILVLDLLHLLNIQRRGHGYVLRHEWLWFWDHLCYWEILLWVEFVAGRCGLRIIRLLSQEILVVGN